MNTIKRKLKELELILWYNMYVSAYRIEKKCLRRSFNVAAILEKEFGLV